MQRAVDCDEVEPLAQARVGELSCEAECGAASCDRTSVSYSSAKVAVWTDGARRTDVEEKERRKARLKGLSGW